MCALKSPYYIADCLAHKFIRFIFILDDCIPYIVDDQCLRLMNGVVCVRACVLVSIQIIGYNLNDFVYQHHFINAEVHYLLIDEYQNSVEIPIL